MMSSPKKPPMAPVPGNVTAAQLSSNQQAVPLPYFAGTHWFPLTWMVSKIYNPQAIPIMQKVGKNSTSVTGYNYYGDVAGMVCLGPVDQLEAIEVGGNIVANPNVGRDGDHPDYADVTVPGMAQFRIYWGTSTQLLDDLLLAGAPEPHPRYLDQCYVVIKGFYFGQGATSVPNVRVLISRSARFDGLDENFFREGANPATALAEVIGNDFFGLGLPDVVDLASFGVLSSRFLADTQTVAIPGDGSFTAHMSFLSIFLDRQTAAQAFFGTVLENFDGWMRRNGALIELGNFPHDGIVPDDLIELTLDDFESKPIFEVPGWSDVLTDVIVVHPDLDWNLQNSPTPGVNAAARQRIGAPQIQTFQRDFVITSYQGRAQANELSKFYSRPQTQARGSIRREKLGTLRPGDRFILNNAPTTSELVVRITQTSDPREKGMVDVTMVSERGLAPLTYVAPANQSPTFPTTPDAIAIVHARVFEVPAVMAGASDPTVVVLAQRPAANAVGFRVDYSNNDTTYDEIETVTGWALRGLLSVAGGGNLSAGAATLTINISGLDTSILQGQTPAGQIDDTLLLIINNEIISIGSVTALGGGSYSLAILRGRQGSDAAVHANGTEAYIILRERLVMIEHSDFPVTALTRYFKLPTFTPQDEQLVSTALRIVFNFNDTTVPVPGGLTLLSDATTRIDQGDGTAVPRLKVSITPATLALITDGGFVEIEFKEHSSGTWLHWSRIAGNLAVDYITDIKTATAYDVRVRFITNQGEEGGYAEVDNYTIPGKATGPAAPSSLAAVGQALAISISWANPADPDFAATELYASLDNNFAHASLIFSGRVTDYILRGLSSGDVRYIWALARNRSGVASSMTGPVNATAADLVPDNSLSTTKIISGVLIYNYFISVAGGTQTAGAWNTLAEQDVATEDGRPLLINFAFTNNSPAGGQVRVIRNADGAQVFYGTWSNLQYFVSAEFVDVAPTGGSSGYTLEFWPNSVSTLVSDGITLGAMIYK